MHQTTFDVATRGPSLTQITQDVTTWVSGTGASAGLLTLFIRHTSASLLVQENADPDVRSDLLAWLSRLVPPTSDPAMSYLKHIQEGPDDMPGHIKAAHLPVSLSIPVAEGRPVLGTWQGIYVVEHRDAANTRQVFAHLAT